MSNSTSARWTLAAALIFATACSDAAIAPEPVVDDALAPAAPFSAAAGRVNLKLAGEGANYVLYSAEYITSGEGDEVGRTIFFSNVGNKKLGHHFVPGDPRRGGAEGITYINDLVDGATGSGLSAAQTSAAIGRAMRTWNKVRCSDIPLENLGSHDFDFGYVQWAVGMGGVPGWAADVTHAGYLPGAFFDASLEPGASADVLGVTFTFMWIDPAGDFTDIDNNGKLDVAFREIYYNDDFSWDIDAAYPDYDVETVALHESGHGLSQAHFGTASGTFANGRIHFSPRALMNAAYTGVIQRVRKTDNAGHCGIWSSWPNN